MAMISCLKIERRNKINIKVNIAIINAAGNSESKKREY